VTDWIWVREDAVLAAHDRQLAEHGGPPGLRDAGGLASALARAAKLAAYGEPDAPALAAAYAAGIARNHPFVDGNKRTAWIAARLFLRINGFALTFDHAQATRAMLGLAAGEISEDELAEWFRERVQRS
jgi:death-on-curing protein